MNNRYNSTNNCTNNATTLQITVTDSITLRTTQGAAVVRGSLRAAPADHLWREGQPHPRVVKSPRPLALDLTP